MLIETSVSQFVGGGIRNMYQVAAKFAIYKYHTIGEYIK